MHLRGDHAAGLVARGAVGLGEICAAEVRRVQFDAESLGCELRERRRP